MFTFFWCRKFLAFSVFCSFKLLSDNLKNANFMKISGTVFLQFFVKFRENFINFQRGRFHKNDNIHRYLWKWNEMNFILATKKRTSFCWNFEIWPVQRLVHVVESDLEKCYFKKLAYSRYRSCRYSGERAAEIHISLNLNEISHFIISTLSLQATPCVTSRI